MDTYEATQKLLETAVPGVNVSSYVLTYDENLQELVLPDFPAVTYNYNRMTPIACHDGNTNLYRVTLEIIVWGNLEQIDRNARIIEETINAKKVNVDDYIFTVVMTESPDISEPGLDFKRRLMTFTGILSVPEVSEGDDGYVDVGLIFENGVYRLMWSGPFEIVEENGIYYLAYNGVRSNSPFAVQLVGTDYMLINKTKQE